MESSPPALKVSVPLNWLMAQVAVDAECFVVTVDEELTSGDKLYVGDKITAIGDEEVLDRAQLRGALASAPNPGGNVTVTVQRTAQPPVDLAVLSTNNAPWSGVFNTHEQHHHMEASGHGGVAGGHRSSLFEIHPTEMSYRRVDDSLRPKLNESVDRLKPDRCILILCDAEFNPADEIKMLADQRKCKPPVYVNAGVKVRLLLNDATFTKAFKAAMLAGSWFVLLRATKAMRLLTLLASLVDEVRARNLEGVHPDARVIVACEPHPHFPDSLTIGAKTLRIRTLPMASTSMMLESISNSSSCRRIVQGGSVTQKALQRRVQLSNALEVVEIEAREVIMAESTLIPSQPIVFHEGSSLLQQHGTFKALPDDKFYGINFAGDANRLAVCSSLGNVYFVDQSGASLVSFHAHDSAVWDLSFSHEYDLVTGGEDGLAVFWSKQGSQDCDTLVCKEVLNFENDVYAVRHTNSKQVVAFGGFLPHVIVRGVTAESQVSSKIDLSTSVQSLFPIHDNHIVAAGADGKVLLLDCNVVKLASATQMHVKKCPCVTASENTVMSGSFDGTVKIWDIRTAPNATPTSIKFSAAVTGIAADGHFMAACVGDGLHVWDLRNVKEPLGSRPGAWKGLSRGVVINAEHNFIGTASPDGVARFWSFEPSSS